MYGDANPVREVSRFDRRVCTASAPSSPISCQMTTTNYLTRRDIRRMTPALLLALEPHLQTAQATLGTTTHGTGPARARPAPASHATTPSVGSAGLSRRKAEKSAGS